MIETRIKICGITTVGDAELAIELGADFLGLNFYQPSPRYVTLRRAQEIALAVAGRVPLVGVFVNAPPATVTAVASRVGLDLLQFHGDETAAALRPFGDRVIKVFRLRSRPASDLFEAWPFAWGFLIEGRHEALYGGSGSGWAYEMISGLPRSRRVFVAGGLTPDNVRGAVRASGAWGVDVCSGVESAPGIKDEKLMAMFFDEVRRGAGKEEG